MDINDFRNFMYASYKERAALPWYIRIPYNVADIIRFRFVSAVKNIPQEFKWMKQKFTKGYSDRDVFDLSTFVINKIYPPLRDFVTHQAERGFSTPAEFKTDPAAWLDILRKIEFSFEYEYRKFNEPDYVGSLHANMTEEQKVEHKKQVEEGFTLFGRFCRNLWD